MTRVPLNAPLGGPGTNRINGCRSCGNVFRGITGFDKHQTVRDGRVYCTPPPMLGMTQDRLGRWYTPREDGDWSWGGDSGDE
jgi:hypothetical protein